MFDETLMKNFCFFSCYFFVCVQEFQEFFFVSGWKRWIVGFCLISLKKNSQNLSFNSKISYECKQSIIIIIIIVKCGLFSPANILDGKKIPVNKCFVFHCGKKMQKYERFANEKCNWKIEQKKKQGKVSLTIYLDFDSWKDFFFFWFFFFHLLLLSEFW